MKNGLPVFDQVFFSAFCIYCDWHLNYLMNLCFSSCKVICICRILFIFFLFYLVIKNRKKSLFISTTNWMARLLFIQLIDNRSNVQYIFFREPLAMNEWESHENFFNLVAI